jgi:broad specificity phosphatase PhoE
MRRWYLVRHAQTVWNSEQRFQGRSDTPLSSLGQQQAARLSTYFQSRPIQAVVSSRLPRSQETARAIAQGNGHRVLTRIEPDLDEIHLGEWEGLTPDEVDARYAQAYAQWRRSPSIVQIPGAEATEVFLQRIRRGREQLLSTLDVEEAVIVTHGGVIAALLADALQVSYDNLLQHLRLDNGGITAVEFWPEVSSSVLWINSTSPLEERLPLR